MGKINRDRLLQLELEKKYTYKQMCDMKIFDKYCTGKGKILQIQEFNQLVVYDKLPRGIFLIKEINADKELEEKTTGRKSIYSESLKPQIVNALSQMSIFDGKILTSKIRLFEVLGLVGEDFNFWRNNRSQLWLIDSIPYSVQNKFFDSTISKCESAMRTALKQLENEGLIDWTDRIMIVKPFLEEHEREATDEEIKQIRTIERETFKEMKRNDLKDVYLHNEMDEFFDRVRPKTMNLPAKIDKYYKGYKIIATEEFERTLVTVKELNDLRKEANELMKKSIDLTSERAKKKALKRIEELEQVFGKLKKQDKTELENLLNAEGNENYFDFIDKLKKRAMKLKMI